MALESIPNILEVYNYAPWLFDGAVICLVLGLLFRLLFEKAHIGKDDAQSAKLGGIVGFVIGLIIVIGMQTKGLQLIDLWSWLVLGILAVGTILLWKWLVELFGEKHKWLVTLFVLVAAVLVAGALLGAMPETTGITIGGWGEGIMRLAMWLAIIVLIGFALSRMPGLGGGEKGKGGWWPKWPFGSGKKPKTPKEEEKEVEEEEDDAKKEEEDADKKTDDADKETEETIEEAKNLKKIKDAARDDIIKIESSIESAKIEDTIKNAEKYRDLAKNHKKLINDAFKELMERRAIDEFDACHRVHDKLIDKVRLFIGGVRTYLDTIKNLKKQTAEIEDAASKGRLEAEREGYEKEVSDIHAEMTAALKKFEDDTKEAINDAQTKAAEKAIAAVIEAKEKLDIAMDVLGVSLNDLARITATDPNLDDIIREIKTGIAAALQKYEILNEKIKDLISQLEYIKSALDAMKNALKNDIGKALDDARAKYEQIKENIERMTEEIAAILAKEDADRKAAAGEIDEINTIIAIVDAQRKVLSELLQHTRQFINTLMTLFQVEEGAMAELETKVQEATEEGVPIERVFSAVSGAKVKVKFQKDPTAAAGQAQDKINVIKGWLDEEFRDVVKNKTAVNNAIAAITKAANDLQTRLNSGAGIPIGHESKLRDLLAKLQAFLAEENKVKNILEDYEKFVLEFIKARVNAVISKKEKWTLTTTAVLTAAQKDVSDLEKLLNTLGTEEYIIRSTAPAPPPIPPHGPPGPPPIPPS